MSERIDQQADLEPEVRKAVQDWTARRELALTGHPKSDALLAYQEGRLGEAEQSEVRDHVVLCQACQQDLLALEAFDATVPEASERLPSELDTQRSWQRFEQQRFEQQCFEKARAGEKVGQAAAEGRFGRQQWGGWIAALLILAVAVVVLSKDFGLGGPKSTMVNVAMAELGSPFVFGLTPDGSAVRRGAESLSEVIIPVGTGPLVPTLIIGDLTAYERYFVEIYAEGGRRFFRREGLARDHQGRITFLVQRADWPPGFWVVRLFGLGELASTVSNSNPPAYIELAAYTLRLRYAE